MKALSLTTALLLLTVCLRAQVSITCNAGTKGVEMSQQLIGAFFEDINYGADGGLYAELVQNRSFEYRVVDGFTSEGPLAHWSLVQKGGAAATYTVESAAPLNANNTNYLKLAITAAGTEVGISNEGFFGIPVKANAKYRFSAYVKCDAGFNQPITVKLTNSTNVNLGQGTISAVTTQWTKYTFEITAKLTADLAMLNLTTTGTGNLYFDMVSLFPVDTYNNRENGLRKDLAQAVADLKPKFLRFPGGCITHGRGIANAYRWKESVGDVAMRKANWNLWAYHQTYGLGFYEYFQYCEDLNAIPLPVLPIGISCQFRTREIVPIAEMGPWIQDALDLVEFANGSTNTQWGALRAQMGHPAPFNMEYLCLGNEEDDIPEFRERFTMFQDTLAKYHPKIKILGTSGIDDSGGYYTSLWQFSKERKVHGVDEHYYNNPEWFLNNVHRYDNFDRNGPKVFIGEYASQNDTHYNAMAEAAYLTGVEKNADVIQFTCYAPLFSCEENIPYRWNPDLIRFTTTKIAKTASYYVQQMYGNNAGDEYLNSTVAYDANYTGIEKMTGRAGVGTWNTQARFDDFKVTSGAKIWINETFGATADNWQVMAGTFAPTAGYYAQTSAAAPAWSVNTTPVDTTTYTITLRAMKTGGNEGFLIPFAFKDDQNFYWFNIGGWNNTQHAVEKTANGAKALVASAPGSIASNTWIDVKIDVTPQKALCYLDGKLIFDIPAPTGPVTASISKDRETNQIIMKLVNTGSTAVTSTINISGVQLGQTAQVTTLAGNAGDRNSIAAPAVIAPVQSTVPVSGTFNYTLAPYSFQVFRIDMTPTKVKPVAGANNPGKNVVKITPNPANNTATIEFPNPANNEFTLTMNDHSGRSALVKHRITDAFVTVDTNQLPIGTYLVTLVGPNNSYSSKMMVAR